MEAMTGGAQIARMLQAEGVEVVFGIIDGMDYGLYASLRERGIALVTPRHETSAVHMAGAYSRLSGKLGVCIASNGPGAANALPGVAVENGEGNRVLLITSGRRSGIVNPDRGGSHQEFTIDPQRTLTEGGLGPDETINTDLGEICFDQLGESMGAHGERVRTSAELSPAIERSLASGRCAVSHIDVDPLAHEFAPNLATSEEMHAEPAG